MKKPVSLVHRTERVLINVEVFAKRDLMPGRRRELRPEVCVDKLLSTQTSQWLPPLPIVKQDVLHWDLT